MTWLQPSVTDFGGNPISPGKVQEKHVTYQSQSRKTRRGVLLLQMHRHQCNVTQIKMNEANMIPPKETNKAPVTDPKEIEIYEMPGKKFKIVILK